MTASELVGGLYGVSLGRAFFGESMFHRARDASKIALVHLVARLQGRRLQAARHAIRHRSSEDLRRGRGAQAALSPAAGRSARRRGRFRRAADRRPVQRRGGAGDLARRIASAAPGCKRALRGAGAPARVRAGGFGAACGSAGASATAGCAAFAVGQPDVVDRMLDRVQAGARREHPAGEDALDLALAASPRRPRRRRRCSASRSAAANSRRAASPAARRTAPSR